MEKNQSDSHINQRMAIPGDQVKTAINRLVEQGEIDEAGKAEIWWLYSYAMDNQWNLDDVGKAIDKDASTAYRLFQGRYQAKYDNLIDSVVRYHKLASARGQRKTLSFVETTTWTKIEQVCRHAFIGQLPAFIYGESQIGKTKCLEEYARRNNHGQTRYIRLPAASGFIPAIKEVAKACYLSTKYPPDELRERIMGSIDNKMLLIIDEVHQPFLPSARQGAGVKIIEWLREIYDRTGCGIVFCGTNVFRDELEKGKFSLILDQFRRRGIIELQLPDTAPKADVVKIAKEFGLPPPEGVANEIVSGMLKRSGLGQYVKFLQSASNLASNQKKQMSWDHFVQSFDLIQALSTKKGNTHT